ncbi:MAG: AAA family ATPase [Actinobacteria bacterium]|nr:AAA family ATPase [Actinomycetota bacterium]
MSFDQLLLVGVAIGLALVGLTFFVGRRDRGARRLGLDSPKTAVEGNAPASRGEDTTDDAVARLAETVGALRRLAELKDQELERDTATRDEVRTGWRPLSPAALSAPVTTDTEVPDVAPTTSVVTENAVAAPEAPTETARQLPPIVTEVSQVRLDPSTKMHPDSAAKLRLSVGQAFTPAAPVARRDLFAGREEQLETLVDVVFERGQHAIVYGERGVGKTSLATILALVFADEQSKLPIRVNCDASDDFDSVWRKILDELELALDASASELPKARAALDRALARQKISPSDATRLLKQVAPGIEAIVIIDEFDTMSDERAPRLFADTIKMLSDQLVPSTVILLGVADTLDELLTEHGSVSRALVHVHMPRMSVVELKDIVTRGLDLLTMDIEDEALDLIARLSQGFPHFTHLLAQAAARAAVDAQRPLVTLGDMKEATVKVSGRIEAWIQDAYEKATASTHDAIYAEVLLAGALAGTDNRGYFAAADVKKPMTRIMGRTYDIPSFIRQLNALSEEDRGPVLVKTGTERKHRYRFVEAQLGPYVIMRSLGDGLIDPEALRELSSNGMPPA